MKEIKISKKKENKARKNTNNIKKLNSELKSALRDIETIKCKFKWIKHNIRTIKKLNDEPRIELIDRLVRFNEFTNKLNMKLM